ncbi:hypothetical protein ABW20_dc0104955 [Dactylellina cionopaga]|nr:hypothetical protein ABW20_dc0104955 [Dactylellina cionopaga]
MLSVPRPVPPLFSTTHKPTITTVPTSTTTPSEDHDDCDSLADQRPSISDDDHFYLPVCSPVVTRQPSPLPPLSSIPGKFPSTKDATEGESKPTKRTSPLTVVQTGVFYFFSCGWCGMTETSKRVRKEADIANQSLRERWKAEIENRPKALRKLIKTTADNVETNIVPSIMARVSHHYHYYTGTESAAGTKPGDVMSMSSTETYAPHVYSRWRGREVARPREGSRAAPPIQNFAESAGTAYGVNNDLMWMMEPPPAPVWKSDGRQGPRLALAEEDEMVRENIRPRLVSKPTTPIRPKPTIMRIPTLPSIESLASRVAEEMQQELENLPQLPPAAAIYSSLPANRRISRPQPLLFDQSLEEVTHTSSAPVSPLFSAAARSLSWETLTETSPRSSSDREYISHGSDGTSSPTTIYSTVIIPRLRSPSLTKSALATRDENGNPEGLFMRRSVSVTERDVSIPTTTNNSSNNSSLILDKLVDKVAIPVPVNSDVPASPPSSPPRSTRRRSIPLTEFRV